MALKMELENLDGLADNLKPLYVEKEGKFVLDLDGPVNTDAQNKDKIPLARLNQEIEKRKASEAQLKELAEQLIEDVPEDKRSIVPDLPPGAKISWLRTAFKMGFFTDPQTPPIDPKRPGAQPPANFEGMNSIEKMASGYGKK